MSHTQWALWLTFREGSEDYLRDRTRTGSPPVAFESPGAATRKRRQILTSAQASEVIALDVVPYPPESQR
jgi:hypothetical protein